MESRWRLTAEGDRGKSEVIMRIVSQLCVCVHVRVLYIFVCIYPNPIISVCVCVCFKKCVLACKPVCENLTYYAGYFRYCPNCLNHNDITFYMAQKNYELLAHFFFNCAEQLSGSIMGLDDVCCKKGYGMCAVIGCKEVK